MKHIKDFKNYYIDEFGNVYSDISGELKKKTPWLDSKGRYYMIGLSKNKRVYKKLIHRLVAEAYIPNPDNKPVVNHKDGNCKNNHINNLEWCSVKENVHHSYKKMNQFRNEIKCSLYYKEEKIQDFPNIKAAARYGSEKFNVSFTGLYRNMKSKYVYIVRCND